MGGLTAVRVVPPAVALVFALLLFCTARAGKWKEITDCVFTREEHKIFVINDGRIAQAGTHDELMKEDGIYRRFVEGRREAVSWKIGESA